MLELTWHGCVCVVCVVYVCVSNVCCRVSRELQRRSSHGGVRLRRGAFQVIGRRAREQVCWAVSSGRASGSRRRERVLRVMAWMAGVEVSSVATQPISSPFSSVTCCRSCFSVSIKGQHTGELSPRWSSPVLLCLLFIFFLGLLAHVSARASKGQCESVERVFQGSANTVCL